MTTTERTVEFSERATATLMEMHAACDRVRIACGGAYDRAYLEMVDSLVMAIAGVARMGGKVSQDGPLSLYVASFIHYGVIFFPNDRSADRDTLLTAPVPGTWSAHS